MLKTEECFSAWNHSASGFELKKLISRSDDFLLESFSSDSSDQIQSLTFILEFMDNNLPEFSSIISDLSHMIR
jgi:hypothetical protein